MKIGPRIAFFSNISNLSKNYLIDFFYSVSNLDLGTVQLKYQRAKRLKFSFRCSKCTRNEAFFIQGAKSTNFQGLKSQEREL